jgi:single-stranded-DNA-specific exonuclease
MQTRIRWSLKTPAPDPAELHQKVVGTTLKLNYQPYRRQVLKTNPLLKYEAFDCAKQLISLAVNNSQHVVIYGDFDCDGVTSITLMRDLLLACEVPEDKIHIVIPHRLVYGYGFQAACLLAKMKRMEEQEEAPGLVIAVDCGSKNVETILQVLDLDISVLVIDHHEIDPKIRTIDHPFFAHLNPKAFSRNKNLRNLCAAGLVYLLAQGIALDNIRWNHDRALLLAGLASYVDVMPLVGTNRYLVKQSLELANQPEMLKLVPGLFLMAKRPQSDPTQPVDLDQYYEIDEYTYGFEWGPCLNAPGRMSTARLALDLLLSTECPFGPDWEKLRKIVAECKNINQWRRASNQAIEATALKMAQTQIQLSGNSVLMLCNAIWHPGIVGIVAARVKERFNRPTFVCTLSPDGLWRGSGRSVKVREKVLFEMGTKLEAAQKKGLAIKGGGHPMAGGLSFSWNNSTQLHHWFHCNSGLRPIHFKPQRSALASAAIMSPEEWWHLFDHLRPFGSDNPCPPLVVPKAVLLGVRPKTTLQRDQHDYKKVFECSVSKTNPADTFRPLNISSLVDEPKHCKEAEEDFEDSDDSENAELPPQAPPVEVNSKTASATGSPQPSADNKPLRKVRYAPGQSYGYNLLKEIMSVQRRPQIWAYEATFLDLATNKTFIAHWTELERAENLWSISHYMESSARYTDQYACPSHFGLELQVQRQIISAAGSGTPDFNYSFRIRQCEPLADKQPGIK